VHSLYGICFVAARTLSTLLTVIYYAKKFPIFGHLLRYSHPSRTTTSKNCSNLSTTSILASCYLGHLFGYISQLFRYLTAAKRHLSFYAKLLGSLSSLLVTFTERASHGSDSIT
jgi:hypothetical protein